MKWVFLKVIYNATTQKRYFAAIMMLSVVLAGLSGAASCRNPSFVGKLEPVSIGSAPLESSALVYVAQDQRFFEANGLSVKVRDYDTGVSALSGLMKNEVDLAIPAEYPLVSSAFRNDQVKAIASIDKVQYFFIVGRKDRQIENISDLKGKRIGVTQKTIAEFYLGRFLALNHVGVREVTLVDTTVSQSEEAISGGAVDAIVSRPPYVNAIEKRLGANGVIWQAQSSQALYAILIGRSPWLTQNPDLVKRLLKSLAKAEDFCIKRPDDAIAIVQKRLNLDDAYMTSAWVQNQFSLTLDQSLVAALEAEARWMMKNGLASAEQAPDFVKYMYVDGLLAIKPGAVNLIR